MRETLLAILLGLMVTATSIATVAVAKTVVIVPPGLHFVPSDAEILPLCSYYKVWDVGGERLVYCSNIVPLAEAQPVCRQISNLNWGTASVGVTLDEPLLVMVAAYAKRITCNHGQIWLVADNETLNLRYGAKPKVHLFIARASYANNEYRDVSLNAIYLNAREIYFGCLWYASGEFYTDAGKAQEITLCVYPVALPTVTHTVTNTVTATQTVTETRTVYRTLTTTLWRTMTVTETETLTHTLVETMTKTYTTTTTTVVNHTLTETLTLTKTATVTTTRLVTTTRVYRHATLVPVVTTTLLTERITITEARVEAQTHTPGKTAAAAIGLGVGLLALAFIATRLRR